MVFDKYTKDAILKQKAQEEVKSYDSPLKIITVNVPERYLLDIDLLMMNGENASRSELIRRYIGEGIRRDKRFMELENSIQNQELKKHNLVRVPINTEYGEEFQFEKEYKTFKVLRRLE